MRRLNLAHDTRPDTKICSYECCVRQRIHVGASEKWFKVVTAYVSLLLVQNTYEDAADVKCHYIWINNLNRLVSQQTSTRRNKKWVCDRCLPTLCCHEQDCGEINTCKMVMPLPHEQTVKFTNIKNKLSVDFTVYADIECLLLFHEEKKGRGTKMCQRHISFEMGYFLQMFIRRLTFVLQIILGSWMYRVVL